MVSSVDTQSEKRKQMPSLNLEGDLKGRIGVFKKEGGLQDAFQQLLSIRQRFFRTSLEIEEGSQDYLDATSKLKRNIKQRVGSAAFINWFDIMKPDGAVSYFCDEFEIDDEEIKKEVYQKRVEGDLSFLGEVLLSSGDMDVLPESMKVQLRQMKEMVLYIEDSIGYIKFNHSLYCISDQAAQKALLHDITGGYEKGRRIPLQEKELKCLGAEGFLPHLHAIEHRDKADKYLQSIKAKCLEAEVDLPDGTLDLSSLKKGGCVLDEKVYVFNKKQIGDFDFGEQLELDMKNVSLFAESMAKVTGKSEKRILELLMSEEEKKEKHIGKIIGANIVPHVANYSNAIRMNVEELNQLLKEKGEKSLRTSVIGCKLEEGGEIDIVFYVGDEEMVITGYSETEKMYLGTDESLYATLMNFGVEHFTEGQETVLREVYRKEVERKKPTTESVLRYTIDTLSKETGLLMPKKELDSLCNQRLPVTYYLIGDEKDQIIGSVMIGPENVLFRTKQEMDGQEGILSEYSEEEEAVFKASLNGILSENEDVKKVFLGIFDPYKEEQGDNETISSVEQIDRVIDQIKNVSGAYCISRNELEHREPGLDMLKLDLLVKIFAYEGAPADAGIIMGTESIVLLDKNALKSIDFTTLDIDSPPSWEKALAAGNNMSAANNVAVSSVVRAQILRLAPKPTQTSVLNTSIEILLEKGIGVLFDKKSLEAQYSEWKKVNNKEGDTTIPVFQKGVARPKSKTKSLFAVLSGEDKVLLRLGSEINKNRKKLQKNKKKKKKNNGELAGLSENEQFLFLKAGQVSVEKNLLLFLEEVLRKEVSSNPKG